jgi:hypothetical protein
MGSNTVQLYLHIFQKGCTAERTGPLRNAMVVLYEVSDERARTKKQTFGWIFFIPKTEKILDNTVSTVGEQYRLSSSVRLFYTIPHSFHLIWNILV